jgi:hypothetical protein
MPSRSNRPANNHLQRSIFAEHCSSQAMDRRPSRQNGALRSTMLPISRSTFGVRDGQYHQTARGVSGKDKHVRKSLEADGSNAVHDLQMRVRILKDANNGVINSVSKSTGYRTFPLTIPIECESVFLCRKSMETDLHRRHASSRSWDQGIASAVSFRRR